LDRKFNDGTQQVDFAAAARIFSKLLDVWELTPSMSFVELINLICGDERESYISNKDFENQLDEIINKGEL